MKPATARKLLLRMHWKLMDTSLPPEPKLIFLGAPHSSIWDFVVAWLYVRAFDRKPRVMIKKEFFFWPLGNLLRSLGAIPVDRKNAVGVTRQVINALEENESFILCIAPEGTRKPVKRWKAGALMIANETGVPLYAGYFDYGTRRISCGEKFPLTGDIKADMKRLQEYYESLHLTARHPKDYITH